MKLCHLALTLCVIGCSATAEKPTRREAILAYLRASEDFGEATVLLQAAKVERDVMIGQRAAGQPQETNELISARGQVAGLLEKANQQRQRVHLAKAVLDAT